MYYRSEMDALFDDDIDTFLEHAGPLLLADEAAHLRSPLSCLSAL